MHRNLVLDKVNSILDATDVSAEEAMISICDNANRVYISGAGRSKLVGELFAMRLMHIGYDVSVVGEVVTPSIKEGDLLIIVSGSGETEQLIAFALKAQKVGAHIVLVTSRPESTISKYVEETIQIGTAPLCKPVRGMPMGTIFELSSLIFFEAIVSRMIHDKNIDENDMIARHANME